MFFALIAATAGDVSHLSSNNYLPPAHHHAASAPAVTSSAAPSYQVEAASAPAVSYSAPFTEYYDIEAASADAYAAAAPESYHVMAASYPAVAYSAPAGNYESASYESAASEPAHAFSSAEGYRYKTVKRRVIRHRRDVSSEYPPPVAASAPAVQYESAPIYSAAAFQQDVQYSAPVSEPAHSYSSDGGYSFKTVRRRVIRRQRRDVSHLSSEYLPPAAASVPAVQYEAAPSYSEPTAPATSYETASYETAAAEPAHSYSSAEGYRYKTAKRRVVRRHRY